ncbi:AzlD domain-containing protein [Alicyclobacillus acidiphilus]|uniref:AzlD domain-containing protein n=1 Tax=Alicyclobacillus acidiphilus TaxID=182455 RepID=UPI00082BB552|nr:AzlD domain-containing protein [Alicyclobacillus acidiphilus]
MNGIHYAIAIGLAAVATYLTRMPPLLLGRSLTLSPRIQQGLRYIPIGVFAALLAPAIALHPATNGHVDWPFWCATAIAIATAWWTRSPLWTMLAGIVVIALVRAM